MFITKPFVKDRKIRFALVGCGRISANHFEALEKHGERAELVGVCDIDPAALAKAEADGTPDVLDLQVALQGEGRRVRELIEPKPKTSNQTTEDVRS